LIHVADLHRVTDAQLPAVERFEPDDRFEQGRLAHAVRTDNADDPVWRQAEREPVDQGAAVKALLQVLGFDDDISQSRARRYLNLLEVELACALGLGSHLLVAGQARLRLRLPALRVRANPVE